MQNTMFVYDVYLNDKTLLGNVEVRKFSDKSQCDFLAIRKARKKFKIKHNDFYLLIRDYFDSFPDNEEEE